MGMRTVFFGTPELAVPSLEAVAARHEVAAVVCQPDRPKGRGKKLQPPPVKAWAEARGIPVLQPAKLNDGAFEAWLREQAPEVCVLAAYGRLLQQPILDVPPHGFINMHPSLLPKYRGPSPIQSAVLNGETITGVSIMRLTLDMDAGDLLLQEEAAIGPNENAEELTTRLALLGGKLMAGALDRIAQGTAQYTPQDPGAATFCRLLSKEDGHIQWDKSATVIHNLVRGARPWPAAQCTLRGDVCKIIETLLVAEKTDATPGTVTVVLNDRVHVAAGAGQVAILQFQAPGKRTMAMGEFLRGSRIESGDRFGEC